MFNFFRNSIIISCFYFRWVKVVMFWLFDMVFLGLVIYGRSLLLFILILCKIGFDGLMDGCVM